MVQAEGGKEGEKKNERKKKEKNFLIPFLCLF
jgi:hypothetical protein